MESHSQLAHSMSVPETQIDQNQNESSPAAYLSKDSPLRRPASGGIESTTNASTAVTTRLTKSTSWFNTLSRRASRKTPTKKRSFAAFSSTTVASTPISDGGINDSFSGSRPRLNKSDWDVRGVNPSLSTGTPEQGSRTLLMPPSGLACTVLGGSRSTDCLDLEDTHHTDISCYPGSTTTVVHTPDVIVTSQQKRGKLQIGRHIGYMNDVTVAGATTPDVCITSPPQAAVFANSFSYTSPYSGELSPPVDRLSTSISSTAEVRRQAAFISTARRRQQRQSRENVRSSLSNSSSSCNNSVSRIVSPLRSTPVTAAASSCYRRNVGAVNILRSSPRSALSPSSPVNRSAVIGGNSAANTPKVQNITRDRMRKYHAVIRLNNSETNANTSASDMSTLDLSNLAVDGGNGGENHVPANPALYYTIDSRRLASKHKKSLRERKLWNGVKQFNLDPDRGLKYLQEFQFIKSDAESVAKFLFRQERLSKKQIGKYLGCHKEFNRSVLQHFVECHEFSQLLLVQALRQFLWSFRLPGEAMQIDRVMDAFAQHYCRQNPYIFQEPDTCFILSFSIIMLNTALHNPNAKMKITVEQFIKQNKGIDTGKDLPVDMQEAIFRNIKEEPFKIPDETYDDLMYTFFSPEREGWLLKQGGSWKTWKRRWFVLNDRCLYYFQHTAENVPKGIIPLENVRVRAVEDGSKDSKTEWAFEIYSETNDIIKGCKTDSSGTVVQGNHKYYRMSANSQEDRDEWIEAIQDSIRDNPFHKIIAEKKANIRRRSGGHSSTHRHHGPAATPSKSSQQDASILDKSRDALESEN